MEKKEKKFKVEIVRDSNNEVICLIGDNMSKEKAKKRVKTRYDRIDIDNYSILMSKIKYKKNNKFNNTLSNIDKEFFKNNIFKFFIKLLLILTMANLIYTLYIIYKGRILIN